ncbi:MAG: DUF2461 domain-containing protein, partial [Pseudomonadota bacterium]
MPQHGFTQESFRFLDNLAENNNRDWFHAHKATFKTLLETPFANLLEALSNRLEDAPRPLMGSKKTMFRMNRDVRFSEDKRLYKTHVSGLLTPSGTKSEFAGIYYLHLDTNGGTLAVGFYRQSPKQLAPIRKAMIERSEDFAEVLDQLKAAGLMLEQSDKLTAMPRGFEAHADHPHADYVRLKSLVCREDLTIETWISGDVIDKAE